VYYQMLADEQSTIEGCGSPTTPTLTRVYIHLISQPLTPGRTIIQAEMPPSSDGFIALDWKDGCLVGIEILDATVTFTMTFSKLPTPNNPAAS
jgi:hypothetical protein